MRNYLLFALLLIFSACNHITLKQANQAAEKVLWSRPDSAIVYLQSASTQWASEDDVQLRQLLLQAAWMRLTNASDPETWNAPMAYYERTNNRERAGQCMYYKGVSFALLHENDSCKHYLQQLSQYENALSPIYMGMTHYRLGVLDEENEHYSEAFVEFKTALPFMQQAGDSLLLSCCYRDLARMGYTLGLDSLAIACFAQATEVATATCNPILSLDIAIQATGNALKVDSAHLLQLYQALGREGSRQHLVEKTAEMTLLQDHLIQERSLRVQRHWGVWLLVVLVVCVGLVLGVIRMRWQRERYRHQLNKLERERLLHDLNTKREVLQSRLRERVSMHDNNMNWEAFYVEFDAAYDGLLSRLQSSYPDLTDMDVRYIALTCLNFDTSDICLLLDLSKRTIYNRRQILKQRLGLCNEDLDAWLTSFSQKDSL